MPRERPLTTPPEFIQSPSECWYAAIAPTREEALAIFENWHDVVEPDALTEIRLAAAPVPDEYRGEYQGWYEVNPAGSLVAWELRV